MGPVSGDAVLSYVKLFALACLGFKVINAAKIGFLISCLVLFQLPLLVFFDVQTDHKLVVQFHTAGSHGSVETLGFPPRLFHLLLIVINILADHILAFIKMFLLIHDFGLLLNILWHEVPRLRRSMYRGTVKG